MLKNYLKVALRYLLRHKGYTITNILGLSVGITCCVLIMLFVRTEFSYDAFHGKSDRIYRVWQHEKYDAQEFINTETPLPVAGALQSTYPEVEATCRIYNFTPMVIVGDNSFSENIKMVDSSFFRLFDFELLQGNRNEPFPTAASALITPELAKKYFGSVSPIGKQFEVTLNENKVMFTVAGIIRKSPEASSIKYSMLIPFSNAHYVFGPKLFSSWFNVFLETYVLLKSEANAAPLEQKLPGMLKQQLGEDYKEGSFMLHLQPIKDIHLNTGLPSGIQPTSNPKYSYILSSIGILILLVACINFITLSIGRSTSRALEVGVRKVLGAARLQLVRQFWGEAFLLTLCSVIIGMGLARLLLPSFNELVNQQLEWNVDGGFIVFGLLLIGVIALVAGIYPAIILSGFRPAEVLKGKLNWKGHAGWLRQSLVVGQFTASIAMIICTIVIGNQMHFLQNKDLGYNKDQVVVVSTNMNRNAGMQLAGLYREELLAHPEVVSATASIFSLAEPAWANLGYTDEKKVYHSFDYNAVDAYFINTMGIRMQSGRDFSPGNAADINSGALVNESFVKEFGIKDPIGKKLPGPFEQQIVGVMKDFNVKSLHTKVQPLLVTITADSVLRRAENIDILFPPQPRISVRLRAGNIAAGLNLLKNAWRSIAPKQQFEYKFLDETVAAQYKAEERTSDIVRIASALSIFIACMGLFGLATLAVARRTKEIGIRKVLGASVPNVVRLISMDFVRLVIIAAIIAFPLAWWFMKDWLKDFAYRVNISWWIFILAGLLAVVIAVFTVGVQAIRAAITNPVKSLRTE